MNIIILLILLASPVFARNQFNPLGSNSRYGNYCGKGYGSINGTKPIDALDRACQIHDICVSAAKLTSCHCNAQIYFSVYDKHDVVHINGSEHMISEAKDVANWIYYTGGMICSEWPSAHINDKYYIAGTSNIDNTGFNYLPVYDLEPGYKYFRSSANITLVMATDEQYLEYTWNDYCLDGDSNLIGDATYSGLFNQTNLVFINCNSGPVELYYGNSAFEAYHWPQKN